MIYDSETIKLNRIDNYIYHQYFKLPNEENWKGGFRAGVAYYDRTPELLHWLNDLSGCWGTDCNNVIWLYENVNDKINPSKGLMRIAFVKPKAEFKQMNDAIDFYIAYSNAGFKDKKEVLICAFNTLEKAQEWLSMG